MRAEQLHEALARDRRRYERLIHRRFRGGVSWEDAEDIVSDALLRAHSKRDSEPPERGKEGAWFTRIVFNQAVDFLRARDGRKR
jgi:DNA-directed RNA polymerase specialized sigma24 family protein